MRHLVIYRESYFPHLLTDLGEIWYVRSTCNSIDSFQVGENPPIERYVLRHTTSHCPVTSHAPKDATVCSGCLYLLLSLRLDTDSHLACCCCCCHSTLNCATRHRQTATYCHTSCCHSTLYCATRHRQTATYCHISCCHSSHCALLFSYFERRDFCDCSLSNK